MKILFFINGLHPGGKERRLVELLKYLKRDTVAKTELAVMSRDMTYPEVLELDIPLHYVVRRTRKDPKILLALYRLCRLMQPDILHTWDSMTAVYAAPIAKLLGVKFINGMIVGAPPRIVPFSGPWIRARMSFPLSDVIVGNSLAGLRVFDAPLRKSVCIYNGFDAKRTYVTHSPEAIRRKLDLQTRFLVAMVGEIAERKDFHTYVLAALNVLGNRSDVTFLVVGDGPYRPKLESLAGRFCGGGIRFIGWQSDVESIVNAIDIGVLATYTEGISNAILEYMAFGKPVVATDGGGTKEIVVDQETGILVRCKDAEQLANAIRMLLDEPGKAVLMGRRGKERISEKFSMEEMGKRYLDLYNKVLANVPSAHPRSV